MKKIFLVFFFSSICILPLCAQQKWDLLRCATYAIEHNISVKQADISARLSNLMVDQSRQAIYPSINSQQSAGYQFGRSIDPTSNQFTTSEIMFTDHSLNLNLDLFNWFRKKNIISVNKFKFEASRATYEKAKDDIVLNVINVYLMTLLAKEQIKIAVLQLEQSKTQLDNIKKQIGIGTLSELSQAEIEAQLAYDSSAVIATRANFKLNLLQLEAILNVDPEIEFDISTPSVDSMPVESLADLNPEKVFQSALQTLPEQKINQMNVNAAVKNVQVARAAMNPSLGLFGGVSSRYSNAQKYLYKNYQNQTVPIGQVNVNGVNYIVNGTEGILTSVEKNSYFRQLPNNFSQYIGVSFSVPLFNAGMLRSNWRRAKLNAESQQLLLDQGIQTLKHDIYRLYTNVIAASERYHSLKTTLDNAEDSYNFALARFNVGTLRSIDLITNQNILFKAKSNLLSAKFDYVFKLKLLEFYKGQGVKL